MHPESHATAEIACSCGRRLDFERALSGAWAMVGELHPEGSVPVSGFSRELRLAPDAERFWFEFVDVLGRRTLVHIVFSRSRMMAEVKQGDAKPLTVSPITQPTQARRQWLLRRSSFRDSGIPGFHAGRTKNFRSRTATATRLSEPPL
jgi:hypothetical protein